MNESPYSQPAEQDLPSLLQGLSPVLQPDRFVFLAVDGDEQIPCCHWLACMREVEGLSLVVSEATARRYGFEATEFWAWISLTVHSSLQAVGLTAAFSRALTDAGISCNVIAATRHDHILVPFARACEALSVLSQLQRLAPSHGNVR